MIRSMKIFFVFWSRFVSDSWQTVAQDGGEFRYMAGMFNMLGRVSSEEWDVMAQIIRTAKKNSKK